MTDWTEDDLRRVGEAEELQLSSYRADGTLRPYVTMWVARVGDEAYVRSAYGPQNGWFRRARSSGSGRIKAGRVERDVGFDLVGADDAVQDALDREFGAKYGRYPPKIVATVVGTRDVTLRLVPR